MEKSGFLSSWEMKILSIRSYFQGKKQAFYLREFTSKDVRNPAKVLHFWGGGYTLSLEMTAQLILVETYYKALILL